MAHEGPITLQTANREPLTARGTAFIETFGCQMNVLDSELAGATLSEVGFNVKAANASGAGMGNADVIIVNTCSVREHAEQKAYSFLGRAYRLKKQNPELVIAVLGCMAQKEGALIFKRAPYVDIVAGTQHFTKIDEYVSRVKSKRERILAIGRDDEVVSAKRYRIRDGRHSLQVAVMRGCDHHCTFCVVPNTRGMEQSKPFDDVVKECEILVGGGAREITLLGQNIDSYGKRLMPRKTLAELLHAVAKVPGLDRLRFITSHPADLKPDLFSAFKEIPNLMPYLHFPAQSGSDRILRAMRRGYTFDDYMRLVDKAREACPEIGLAGDTIVGFPTETDTDFERTLELHRRAEYQNAFVFTYSHREFTPAEKMELKDDVPEHVKNERVNELLRVQREVSERVLARHVGKVMPVLFDRKDRATDPVLRVSESTEAGFAAKQEARITKHGLSGRSPQNLPVHVNAGRELTGEIATVRITRATGLALYGELE